MISNKATTPPPWAGESENMLVTLYDMEYYYDNFTKVIDGQATENQLAIKTLDGRVTTLEQQIPVGPGGKGAYLNLGGTPERYPTAEEMVAGDTPEETSFMVVARADGIYFFNPKTKQLIPPKKGGGTVAIHASFPDLFDAGHTLKHDTRAGTSGIYTARVADLNLDANFLSYNTCKVLVVTDTNGTEYQTALHPDGTASRIFTPGNNTAPWSFHSGGGGGGGGSIDPAVIQEINRRLQVLEDKDVEVEGRLDNVDAELVTVDDRLKELEANTKPISEKRVSGTSYKTDSNVTSVQVAANATVIVTGNTGRSITLPSIVPASEATTTSTEVREGRTTYLVSSGDASHSVLLQPTQMFFKSGGMDSAVMEVTPRSVATYRPAILDNGSGAMIDCWVYLGSQPLVATDMSGILSEIQELKDKHDTQQAQIDQILVDQTLGKDLVQQLQQTDIELVDRIVALENPQFLDLVDTPGNYTDSGGKLVSVKSDRTGLEFTSLPDYWSNTSSSKISGQNLLERPWVGNGTFPQTMSSQYDFFAPHKSTANRSLLLPTIVEETATPTNTQARVGRRITGANMMAKGTSRTLTVTGPMIRMDDTGVDSLVLMPGDCIELLAVKLLNASNALKWLIVRQWNAHNTVEDRLDVLENKPDPVMKFSALSDTPSTYSRGKLIGYSTSSDALVAYDMYDYKPLEDRLSSHDTSIASIEATNTRQDNSLDTYRNDILAIKAEQLTQNNDISAVEDRVDVLESAPAPKFTDLTDTPSTYSAGKLIGYNLGGTALIPYDRTLKSLTDTPNDYAGNRGKLLAVKSDESALEFVNPVDISGLQTDVNNLHNDMVRVGNEQTIQDNKIKALETAPKPKLTDLTDTPNAYTGHGGKVLAVNSGATATEFRDLKGDLWNRTSGYKVIGQNSLIVPWIINGTFGVAQTRMYDFCAPTASTANRQLVPPEIVAATATPTADQSRVGRTIRGANLMTNAVNKTLTVGNGVNKLRRLDGTVLDNIVLDQGWCIELLAVTISNVHYWLVVNLWYGYSIPEERLDVLENTVGVKAPKWSTSSLVTSESYLYDDIYMKSGSATSVNLPIIVRSVPGASQRIVGTRIRIHNLSSTQGVTLRGDITTASGDIGTRVLSSLQCAALVATETSSGVFRWVMAQTWQAPTS